MVLFHEVERHTPQGVVEEIETGTGLFNSDYVTIFDAGRDNASTISPIPHVTDINTYVIDVLESNQKNETANLPQPQLTTSRRPLSVRRIVATAILPLVG